MPLFALMDKNTANPILRVNTDNKTDQKLLQTFQDQGNYFDTHHNTKVDFYAGYKPSYGECFELINFINSAPLIDAVTRNTAIPQWDPKTIGLEHIKALFMGIDPANPNKIAIQTFNKSQILDVSKSLFLSKNTFTMASTEGFNVDDKVTAIIENNTIRFKSFHKLRSMFDMDVYFTEATDQDLDDFSKHSKFSLPQGFDLKIVADTVIRNKITLINSSGILNTESLPKLKAAATKINFQLDTIGHGVNEKIIMPQGKREIKKLLEFLDEDIFTSELSQKIYKTNSKRPYV